MGRVRLRLDLYRQFLRRVAGSRGYEPSLPQPCQPCSRRVPGWMANYSYLLTQQRPACWRWRRPELADGLEYHALCDCAWTGHYTANQERASDCRERWPEFVPRPERGLRKVYVYSPR